MGTENGFVLMDKRRSARIAAYCAWAAIFMLSACDGGGSKPNAVSAKGFEAQLAGISISATDGATQAVRFSILSTDIDASTLLACQWDAAIGVTDAGAESFECNVGSGNRLDFSSEGFGEFTGQLSVTLPDGTVASSLVNYVVQEKGTGRLVNVSDQFSESIRRSFHLFQSGSASQTLLYFPRRMGLSSAPGIASVQLSDKVDGALEYVLQQSAADWTAQNQLTFSSRFSLDVDTQSLRDEAQAIGFDTLSEAKVQPPSMAYTQRYVTDIPQERIVISCDELSQEINGRLVTLLDCYIADSNDEAVRSPINLVQSVFFEPVDFDPSLLTSSASIRGNFNIVYSLPGTHEFSRLAATNNADLSQTFQLHFKWPLIEDEVKNAVVSFYWQDISKAIREQGISGKTVWSEEALTAITQAMAVSGYIAIPSDTAGDAALIDALTKIMKQEFFVAITSPDNLSDPLFWTPKLRFIDVNSAQPQDRKVQYFSPSVDLHTELDLTCISWPDAQNNVYRSPDCAK